MVFRPREAGKLAQLSRERARTNSTYRGAVRLGARRAELVARRSTCPRPRAVSRRNEH